MRNSVQPSYPRLTYREYPAAMKGKCWYIQTFRLVHINSQPNNNNKNFVIELCWTKGTVRVGTQDASSSCKDTRVIKHNARTCPYRFRSIAVLHSRQGSTASTDVHEAVHACPSRGQVAVKPPSSSQPYRMCAAVRALRPAASAVQEPGFHAGVDVRRNCRCRSCGGEANRQPQPNEPTRRYWLTRLPVRL